MKYNILYYFFSFFLFSFSPFISTSQNLFPEQGEVFRDDVIPRIDITLPQDSLTKLFDQDQLGSYHHYKALFVFDNGTVRDTLEDVGFRLRGNTSRHSAKKSYKISFNTYEAGRKYHGLEKLNLNGEHNDPSVIRAKICWDLVRNMEIPGSRSNHIDLYVNGYYFGVYINVEHVDEEFVDLRFGSKKGNLYKCLWPADLDYRGSNPDLYKFESGGRRTYELRTNTEEDDYSDLAHFIDVLNNTSLWDIPCELEKVFNVDNMIRSIAMDILTGNWDGPHYNKNNFYLYNNPISGKFEYIPYDLDNTLGIDWLGRDWGTRNVYKWGKTGEDRPLFYKILSHPDYRNRLTFYLNQVIEDYFNEEVMFPYIDQIRAAITSGIINDPFRPLDYDFSFQDFLTSYSAELDEWHVQYGLKPYISTRMENTLNQLEHPNIRPIITKLTLKRNDSDWLVQSTIIDDESINTAKCCFYTTSNSDLQCFDIKDDGEFPDETANDNMFSGILPIGQIAGSIYYYIEAKDNTDLENRYPLCFEEEYSFGVEDKQLFINEILAWNKDSNEDEYNESDDWIEIYYAGPDSIFLGDKYLTDSRENPTKWKCPNIYLNQGEFAHIWADNDEEQGSMHANFKLNKEGDFIGLYDIIGVEKVLLHGFDFGQQKEDVSFGSYPDASIEQFDLNPTPGYSNTLLQSKEIKNDKFFNIYPNPTSGQVNIHFSNTFNDTVTHIYLMDLKGIKTNVISHELNSGILSFSISALASGLYNLHIITDKNTYWEKLIVE